MDEQSTGMPQAVEVQPTPIHPALPHRGVLILVLGILGIVCCVICGIIAWVMGSGDLKEMDAGLRDPAGRGLTRAGKILGIIGVILQIIAIIVGLLMSMLGVFAAPMSTY